MVKVRIKRYEEQHIYLYYLKWKRWESFTSFVASGTYSNNKEHMPLMYNKCRTSESTLSIWKTDSYEVHTNTLTSHIK